ncbi:hypothetical protein C2845_PM18G03040 [Panicum miliaceum]|uniref:Uncharacterized protein n=1 Tax=Panicum miliaceum TaxID=4540 RepID=A0A3L6PFX2_PANMI|nr:hypothetical protein C2845_PM18G03040 [Panicum miliaceum]
MEPLAAAAGIVKEELLEQQPLQDGEKGITRCESGGTDLILVGEPKPERGRGAASRTPERRAANPPRGRRSGAGRRPLPRLTVGRRLGFASREH